MSKRLLSTLSLAATVATAVFTSRPASAEPWPFWDVVPNHEIVGTIVAFEPYRLQVQRPNGRIQLVDLKDGTIIQPRGATPGPGERVAMLGYYSNGTFIVNRMMLR